MPSLAWEALLNRHQKWPNCYEQGEAHFEEAEAGMPRHITLLSYVQSPFVEVHRRRLGTGRRATVEDPQVCPSLRSSYGKGCQNASNIHVKYQSLGPGEAIEFRDKPPL